MNSVLLSSAYLAPSADPDDNPFPPEYLHTNGYALQTEATLLMIPLSARTECASLGALTLA